ncbi:hypothetical protein DYB26_004829 [Aphanomyces astaci]|uniref:SLC26A/SulP transporter domain-containing protein n=1 Tax=Aphanomyces astaci TaxID=112090 RepID=A0A397EMU5_APHAT|nr:hypothetical protein DYB34_004463 [Aphanomyces astaci]RHZ00240.1 hypothetical protein DYB31_014486 [Aphanomyces astaci]RHZ13157.1 hypothetical protein DYB26_004829 [Aphanomyces astaci]
MSVVGGYLSLIRFYCFEAEVSMMSGQQINSVLNWGPPINPRYFVYLRPKGVFLFVTTQRVKPYSTLPATMNFLDIYKHFQPSHIHAEFMLDQLPSWIAMYFVVAFSSSLDVAAIEMALHKPLDHYAELQTVGWSNVISGLTGGFTGSHLVRAQAVYFASLQTFIAIDLTMEWMVHYANLWLTFVIMDVLNLEAGIVLGTIDARLASASFRGNAIFTFELVSCNIETGLSYSISSSLAVVPCTFES